MTTETNAALAAHVALITTLYDELLDKGVLSWPDTEARLSALLKALPPETANHVLLAIQGLLAKHKT